ncbi:MAG TPA: hypothetical protein DIT64_16400 [Verrucomicrobiales bacterium]|nr:hypothetical protein [Verrucomicrobiales bacterium]
MWQLFLPLLSLHRGIKPLQRSKKPPQSCKKPLHWLQKQFDAGFKLAQMPKKPLQRSFKLAQSHLQGLHACPEPLQMPQ